MNDGSALRSAWNLNRARVRAMLARAHRGVQAAAVGPDALGTRRRYGNPDLILAFFGGIGDELLMTVVLRELRRRGFDNAWVMSEYADIWRDNPDPARVLPWDRRYARWIRALGWELIEPHYTFYLPWGDRDAPPPKHILTVMCELVGIVGPIARRPYLHLSDAERERGARVPQQIAIQSAGLDARFAMKTKQWFPERFQAVVNALRGNFNFVQIGSVDDPPLEGVLDLRGKTSLRETAAILAHSLVYVGQVGMPMHLARAVECRSVIVYGGREHPRQTGYSCNENLYTPVPCSPCWKSNSCGHAMMCMREITAPDVVRAVERQVLARHQPLVVDVDVIPATRVPSRTTADGRTLLSITDVKGARREIEAKFAPMGDAPAAAIHGSGYDVARERTPRVTKSAAA